MNPKIIFFGNTKYSKIGLQIVHKAYSISQVVTISGSPVERLAHQLKIPVLITNKLNASVVKKLVEMEPDFLLVEDYGLILPKELLALPKYVPINIHHSLLPKYRGPSPAPAAILNGDKVSGVTIINMAREVDTGDILAQEKYELTSDETTDSLLTKLNEMGARLAIKVIKQYQEGSARPIPQNNSLASYTDHFTRETGYIDLPTGRQVSPEFLEELDRKIRAYFPWPGVWTRWNGKIIKLLPTSNHPELDSGSIRFIIQMEGKKPISLKDFLNGYPDFPLKML